MDAMKQYEANRQALGDLRAELKRRMDAILAQVKDELDALHAELDPLVSAAEGDLSAVEAALKQEIIAAGVTVKGEHYMAVFNKPRVTWDTAKLEGLALAHPEILALKKMGEPTVTIREIKT